MLTRLSREEIAQHLDFAYELAMERTCSAYPTYTDGIKTREDFVQRTYIAFEREHEDILLFTLSGKKLGWIHYYALLEDDYLDFCAFNIAEHSEIALEEFIVYAKERYPQCTMYIGLPEENFRMCNELEQLGFSLGEQSLVGTLHLENAGNLSINSDIVRVDAENYAQFSALHAYNGATMYWNSERIWDALDEWNIYLLQRDGQAVGAIYFIVLDDLMEIFGVDYVDNRFDEETFAVLLSTAITEAKKLGCKHSVYFHEEQEHPIVEVLGYTSIGTYKMYLHALTEDLLPTYETEHYVFHYQPHSLAQRDIKVIAAQQEACYAYICKVLRTQPAFKLHYHLCSTPEEVGAYYGDDDPCNGFARKPCDIYAVYNEEIQCIGFHEDAHLISYTIASPISSGLREGLAMYFDRKWWGIANEEWAFYYLSTGKMPALRDLLTNETFFEMSCELSYPIVGFVTDYILCTYGIEAYLRVYKQEQDTIAALEALSGKSIDAVDQEIRDYLHLFRQDAAVRQRIEVLLAE